MIIRNLLTFGLIALSQLVCSTYENVVDELSAGGSNLESRAARSIIVATAETEGKHDELTILRRRKREAESGSKEEVNKSEEKKEGKDGSAAVDSKEDSKTEKTTEKPCKAKKKDKEAKKDKKKKKKNKKKGKKHGKKKSKKNKKG